MSYKSKAEVLECFQIIPVTWYDDDPDSIAAWELFFVEGGKKQRVAIYYAQDEMINYADEDSLMYWLKVLKRSWDDDEDFEPIHEEKKQLMKFRVED